MLQNAYLLAKIGADTAENEQHFAEILPICRLVADPPRVRRALQHEPRPVPLGAHGVPGVRRVHPASRDSLGFRV